MKDQTAKRTRTSDHAMPNPQAPSDPDFRLDSYLFNVIGQLDFCYRKQLHRAFKPVGVTLPVWRTLCVLKEEDGLTVTQLADRTATERTALTRVIRQMSEAGLVLRKHRADDARASALYLTGQGRALLKKLLPIADRVYKRVTVGVAQDRLKLIHAELRFLWDNAR